MSDIFYSDFYNGFNNFNDPDIPALVAANALKIVAGRGIMYGNAVTCSNNIFSQNISDFASPLQQVRFRFTEQFYSTGLGTGWPYLFFNATEQISWSSSYSSAFNMQVYVDSNGELSASVAIDGITPPFNYTATGAAGDISLDGTPVAIEITYNFTSNSVCVYNIIVNGVSKLADTITATGIGYWSQSGTNPVAGINVVSFHMRKYTGSLTELQTSIGEIYIDTDISTTGLYTAKYMPRLSSITCATALSPMKTGSGIYILDPNSRHDTFYEDTTQPLFVYKKIPKPTATTYLMGDE